jgi:hypothetical protein
MTKKEKMVHLFAIRLFVYIISVHFLISTLTTKNNVRIETKVQKI